MDNLYTKFQPIEQQRWNQANIDTMFYAGEQSFVNQFFNFSPSFNYQQYYFNLCQQPVNMVTGYQRQHQKSINYVPIEGADAFTTDQYTRLISENNHKEGINDLFSKSCELSAIAGLNLLQPYLDFSNDDPAQGSLRVKVWEYNSFIVDPYFRESDMSDANFIWCQEYISKQIAKQRFGDKVDEIRTMEGSPQRYGNFYFLPENYNLSRNDLLVVSYIWYRWTHKKQRLYSRSRNQFFDMGKDGNIDEIINSIPDLEKVTTPSTCWKVAIILNDQLMHQGINPLWDGPECPFIPNFWNYDPHISYSALRSRSLIFSMRAPQFLANYKIIQNNDIASATINSGYKRKVGAVANEDNLKKASQGYDILINEGYELTDCEKIIPTAVPESDLALAQQMIDLIFKTSGIDMENWSAQQDKNASTLTTLIKQAANLMVFQKYFNQWDRCLKILGERMLQYAINNWNAAKVSLLIGEEPTAHFYSRVFAKYKVLIQEADLTPTQQNLQAQQMFEVNERFGREVFPPSMIIPKLNISGKGEIIQFLQQQEQNLAAAQNEDKVLAQAFQEAQLKELISRATANLATARERHGRAEADIGLFEERLSEITQNRAMATKAKMEALEKLVDVIAKYGEIEAALRLNQIETYDIMQSGQEDIEKADAKRTSLANQFKESIMGNQQQMPQMAQMR